LRHLEDIERDYASMRAAILDFVGHLEFQISSCKLISSPQNFIFDTKNAFLINLEAIETDYALLIAAILDFGGHLDSWSSM